MSNGPVIYLASQSARRKDILKAMKLPFKVVASTYQERRVGRESPSQLVLRHAIGKAKKGCAPRGARIILGADTVVALGNKILGKPKSMSEAKQTLKLLQNKSHWVYTGVAFYDPKKKKVLSGIDQTKVCFKKLTAKQIDDYLEKVNPLDKAGSYAIQKGPKIVREIEGSYSNVVGLPRVLVRRLYRQWLAEAPSIGPKF